MIKQPIDGETWREYYKRMSGLPIRKACPTCSRLLLAWAAAPDSNEKRAAYLTHRAGCGMRMGTK